MSILRSPDVRVPQAVLELRPQHVALAGTTPTSPAPGP